MKTICFYFQIHQPFRLKRYRFFDIGNDHYYYDDFQNEEFIKGLADLYESKGKYLSVLLGENGDPFYANKLKAVMRPVLLEMFGLSEGEIHTAYIFEFGFSAILSTITYWYQNNKNLPSKELLILMRSMLMNGIYSEIQRINPH